MEKKMKNCLKLFKIGGEVISSSLESRIFISVYPFFIMIVTPKSSTAGLFNWGQFMNGIAAFQEQQQLWGIPSYLSSLGDEQRREGKNTIELSEQWIADVVGEKISAVLHFLD